MSEKLEERIKRLEEKIEKLEKKVSELNNRTVGQIRYGGSYK